MLTGAPLHTARAHQLLRSFGATLQGSPLALGEMLLALEHAHSDPRALVLVRPADASDEPFLARVRGAFSPHLALLRAEQGRAAELAALTSPLRERVPQGGACTAWLCREGACGLPATAPAELARQLEQ